MDVITKNNVKVLNIYRDGRDAIESGWHINCERWIHSIRQMKRAKNCIFYNLGYEELVLLPDLIQGELGGKFNLKAKRLFSEYPDFVPSEVLLKEQGESYRGRPITTDRIGKNLELYRETCPENLLFDFERYLEELNYKEVNSGVR